MERIMLGGNSSKKKWLSLMLGRYSGSNTEDVMSASLLEMFAHMTWNG